MDSSLLGWFEAAALSHLWQSSVVLVLIFALAAAMRRAPARLLHLLWLVALAKILLPLPLLGGLFGRLLPAAGDATGSLAAGRAGIAALLAPEILIVRPEAASAGFGPAFWALLWFAGAAAIAAVWLRSSVRTRALAGRCEEKLPRLCEKLARALKRTGIPRDRLHLSTSAAGPCVVGLLRPRIVLPPHVVDRLKPPELRAILLHEEAHRRRRDPLLSLFQRVAILAFYYHPLLWPVLHRLKSTTEMACDEHVLSQGVARETYARALARTVRIYLGPAPALAAEGHSRSVLQQRFHRIAEHGRYVAMRRHLVLLAAAICIAAATSFFPIAPPASAGPIEAMAPGGAGAEDLQFVELSRLREPDLRVTMKFTRTSADRVLMALSGAADLDLRFEGARPVTLVDLDAESMSLKQALQRLSRIAGVRYRVPDPDTLIAFVPKTVLDAPAQELDLARSENEALVGILLAGMDGVGLPTRVEESYVKPVYPEDAREQRVEGRVILQAVIRGDGSVGDVQVLNSTPPDLGFEKAAIEAVERWRYDPAMKDGKPVDVYFTVRVDFDLQ